MLHIAFYVTSQRWHLNAYLEPWKVFVVNCGQKNTPMYTTQHFAAQTNYIEKLRNAPEKNYSAAEAPSAIVPV